MNTITNLLGLNIIPFQLEKLNLQVRPNASNGIWLLFLLPTALIVSAVKNYIVLTDTYKLLPIFSIGIIFTNLLVLKEFRKENYVRIFQLWFCIPVIVLFFYQNEANGILFAIYSGIFCTVIYSKIYYKLLEMFPKSFTLGEAGMTAQAVIILFYTLLPHFYRSLEEPVIKTGQSSTLIIQMELFGIILLTGFLYFFKIKGKTVYFWSFIILLTTFLLPLHIFLRRSPILWVLNLLIEDLASIRMILYWVVCCCLAALAVIRQKNVAGKASTSERKIFHILAVAVYIPGLIYKCNLLYLGSGMLLGIFLLLEIIRNFEVPPLGSILQQSFAALSDEKDAGILAVTPIYLLTGFTMPIWIHPAPCDLTDSAYFNFLPLLSGILSVGIGDTVASVFGSRFGKHFYYKSKKTIEGTLASIISQLLTIYVLNEIGFIPNLDRLCLIKVTISIITTSFIEAKTDQIDNLILPIIMYIMLI